MRKPPCRRLWKDYDLSARLSMLQVYGSKILPSPKTDHEIQEGDIWKNRKMDKQNCCFIVHTFLTNIYFYLVKALFLFIM